MNKRFCILQVAPKFPNPKHVEMFKEKEHSDFYFVTHDGRNSDALEFCPNTIWSETRNILVDRVPKIYDYHGFIDYDYILTSRSELKPPEQIIKDLEWNPAVLTYYPGKTLQSPYAHDIKYLNSRERSCIPFTHAGFKLVHKSLLKWFFPLYTKHRVDIDACHMFNIQEIPFLRHVICSHKMIYDNGVSSESVYNTNEAYTKLKMDQMWQEFSSCYKQLNLLKKTNYNPLDSMSIKKFYVDLFKQKQIENVKNSKNVNFLENQWIKEHI